MSAAPTLKPEPLALLHQRWWQQRFRDRSRLEGLADEALALAGDAPQPRAGALVLKAWSLAWGPGAPAEPTIDEAHRLFAQLGDGNGLASCQDLRAQRRLSAGDFAGVLTLLASSTPTDRAPQARGETHRLRMDAHRGLDQHDDALREGYRLLEAAVASGDPAHEALALALLGGLQADLHNLEDAERLQRRACGQVDVASALQAWWLANINLMCTLDYQGRAAEALPLAEALQAREADLPPARAHHRLLSYAAVFLHSGATVQAQALLDRSIALAPAGAGRRIEWAWLQAELHNGQGRAAEARGVCEPFIVQLLRHDGRTGDDAERVVLPYDRVRLFEEAAKACDQLGDVRAALAHQRSAFSTYRELVGRSARARRLTLEIEHELALERQQRERAEAERERLATLNDALHAANRAKSDFLAAASHDLRQPVHALALQVAALRGEPDSTRRQQRLDRIDACVGALSGLFDALLDLSRIDAGVVAPQWQPVPLALLLDELVQTHRAEAERKGLWLSLRLSAHAHGATARSDASLLERVLRNLIVNAVRHTRQGGVLVTLRGRGAGWRIDVRDSGPGIDPALHVRIFDEFFQASPSDRQRGEGLGLGLAIVQRLARLLGHGVALRSAPGQGTSFAVTLERTAPGPRPISLAPVPAAALPPLRAIVIEDDRDAREALVDLLEQWGCTVAAAEHIDALQLDAAWRPDVALLDVRLPEGRNGIDEAARLRAVHGAALPCLLITGESAPESLRRIEASGLPWLHKPLAVPVLQRWLAGVATR